MIGLLPGRPSERLAWQWRGTAGIVAVADRQLRGRRALRRSPCQFRSLPLSHARTDS